MIEDIQLHLINPFPKHDHPTWPVEIGIGDAIRTRTLDGRAAIQRKITTRATTTCNEFLFVHPTYPNHDVDPDVVAAGRVVNWTVTHSPTGCMVMTGIPDERTAMYLAGAVSRLCAWGGSGGGHRVTDYERVFRALPNEIAAWLRLWRYKNYKSE